MTVPEAINLFKSEMHNEIFHAATGGNLQDALLKAVDDVATTVSDTYKAEQSKK